jgi:hypothetical protein
MSNVDFTQVAGIFGFLCYIMGFAGGHMGYINGNGNVYTLTSLAGASLVLLSLIGAFNLASMLIQISWIVICITALLRRSLNSKHRVAKP